MNAHEHTEQLIPWYVNGTLDEQDMARVQQHLTDCRACRTTVEESLGLARQLHRPQDDPRVEALIARQDDNLAALRARLHPRPVVSRRTFRLVPMLAALVVLTVPVAFVATGVPPLGTEHLFEARTTTTTSQRPVLQLVFVPGTSAEDIALLLAASGTVIGEPSQHGVYRIALATDRPEELLMRIRRHPAVRWAEIEL
jgi:anti-sigma factor RsiW